MQKEGNKWLTHEKEDLCSKHVFLRRRIYMTRLDGSKSLLHFALVQEDRKKDKFKGIERSRSLEHYLVTAKI